MIGPCLLVLKVKSSTEIDTAKEPLEYSLKWISKRDEPPLDSFRVKFKEAQMLYWTIVFFVVAIIAGVLGFTGVAIAAAGVAKLLFFVFLVLFVISLFTHMSRRGTRV